MTQNRQPFWRYFEKVGLLIAIVFAILLIAIYLLLLYQRSQNFTDTVYAFFLEVLSEVIPALLIVSASLGIFRYFEHVQKEEEQGILITKIAGAVSGGESISEFGLVKIHDAFPNNRLKEAMRTARRVRVLTTWISDPIRDIEIWQDCVQRRDCKIEILLINPNSDFARQRGKDLNLGEAFVVSSINNSISHLANLAKIHQGSMAANGFALKLYSALPSVYFFICDDVAFVGFYWHTNRATHAPIFEFNRVNSTSIGNMLNREFEKVYNSDSTIDMAQLGAD